MWYVYKDKFFGLKKKINTKQINVNKIKVKLLKYFNM